MVKKNVILAISFCFFLSVAGQTHMAFAEGGAAKYLCDLGIAFYNKGYSEEALNEFNKVLLADPTNNIAKEYISKIFSGQGAVLVDIEQPSNVIAVNEHAPIETKPTKDEVINRAFQKLSQKSPLDKAIDIKSGRKKEESRPPVKVKGLLEASVGATPDDVIWNQADYNLNEEDWRILSKNAYNRRENTYDTRIYDRLMFDVDAGGSEGLAFHTNVTIDPWSFVGKSGKFTIHQVDTAVGSTPNDYAELELLAWGNSKYTKNQTVYTRVDGASIAIPEIKISDGKTAQTNVESTWTSPWPTTYFVIPETDIDWQFQPLRELWFDYNKEVTKFRFFPIAYENQALNSDDPLRVSNNRSWWEESPWLDKWSPGVYNTDQNDFTKGKWDDALSYSTRDDNNTKLTALRGFSFNFEPSENTSFSTTAASPKGLWQDYDSFDNIASATRFKHYVGDNLMVGSTYTARVGFNEDDNKKKDAVNQVMSADVGYEIVDGLKASAQVAHAINKQDLTSPGYQTKSRGNAYYFSLFGSNDGKNIMDSEGTYDSLKPDAGEDFFLKHRLILARMDKGFKPALATYRQTRKDAFWSRHIHFKRPFEYFYMGVGTPSMKYEDIESYKIGTGLDSGRSVVGLRVETSMWDQKLDNLFDVRNVHRSNGKYLETVGRDEVEYLATDKLTVKLFGLYQDMHKTYGKIDPFLTDNSTGEPVVNTAVTDGADPSLKTGSLGAEYAFFDWLALNGVWERSNDYSLAYDNFPRGNLNSTTFSTHYEYDRLFRTEDVFLYNQALFPQAPYPLYDIFKTGLRFDPTEKLSMYLDYTRNEFKSAGQIDDNINHIGLEFSYLATKKSAFYCKYTYSRWNDVNLMLEGKSKYYLGNHNFFAEFRYLPGPDSEFIIQYGESGRAPVYTSSSDPFGSGLATLDTRHIVRLFYRKKF